MYDQRVKKVRDKLLERSIDSLLISNFYNILYLTGFKTLTDNEREAFVLVTKNKVYLFTDERYVTKNFQFPTNEPDQKSVHGPVPNDSSGTRVSNFQFRLIEPEKGLIFHLRQIVKNEGIKTLGFEAEDLKFYEYQRLKEQFKDVALLPTSKMIVKIRELKDEEEIGRIDKACEIGDQCLSDIIKIIKQGTSEKELAFKIEMWIKGKGYDLSFDPIVAVDANSAVAHYNTKDGEGTVKSGSVILIDFGVKYKDYLSDITRMVFFGKPSSEIMRAYEILSKAQAKTVEKVAELDSLKGVDNFCRSQITSNNLPSYPHSTGHGVGLEIHEYPKVSFNSADRKVSSQVFTVEPGVYFPGKFGMRVEDTVAIGKDLKAKVLTKFPKSLLAI